MSAPSLMFMGTGTTPARIAPNITSTNSKRLPMAIAMRSPGRRPAAEIMAAKRSSRSSSSR